MEKRRAGPAFYGAIVALSLCCFAACKASRSSGIKSPECCAAFQHTDALPEQPPQGVIRLAIGGDSRDDRSHVVPWAFKEARRRGAKAFFFLGDLEITSAIDKRFLPGLADLGEVGFYPVMGNHEVETLGITRLPLVDSQLKVKKFKNEFLMAQGIHLAPFVDEVVYSVDLQGGIHFIALDNVSRTGEGFGPEQLAWLEQDLKAASAERKVILVGMHKALAKNPVTRHAMDEDGPRAIKDSDDALDFFKRYKVAMVFVSHSHMYAAYPQDGIEMRLTGGLGAPLVKCLAKADGGFHHFLFVDVPSDGTKTLQVEVVPFQGNPTMDPDDESVDDEAERFSLWSAWLQVCR